MVSCVARPSFFFGGGEANAEGLRPSMGGPGACTPGKMLTSRVPKMRFSSILGVKSCRIPKIIKYVEDISTRSK
jgi:hypothetical protein